MKSRACTFLLSLVILGASLATFSNKTYSSDAPQYKVSNEFVTVAIAPKLRVATQGSTDHLLTTFGSLSLPRPNVLHQKISFSFPTIRKSGKTYLILRVLRN